jgi:hypothetical protein
MSSQIPPDPITSNYNPTAWSIPELTEEERIALDKAYITFPIAQNKPITFPSAITIPTPALGSNTTLATTTAWVRTYWASILAAANTWTGTQTFTQNITIPTAAPESNTTVPASTAWVRTFWASILAAANSWSGLQTFSSGIITDTINPISGGTLLIGNATTTTNVEVASVAGRSVVLHLGDGNGSGGAINIGNGTNATNNVQILNGTGSTGTITLGSSTSFNVLGCPLSPNYSYPVASGRIGATIAGTNAGTLNLVAGTSKTLSTIVIPTGIWVIHGSFSGYANSTYLTIGLSTTNNSVVSGLVAINTSAVAGTSPATVLTFIVSTATTYYLVGVAGTSGTTTSVVFNARRIA